MNVIDRHIAAQRQTVTRVLRQARARRNPADIPGFTAAFGPRDKPGITQEETAKLAGVSKRWYGNLETGKPRNYSDAFLYAIRRILDLDLSEWDAVYRITRGQAPPVDLGCGTSSALPDAIRTFVQDIKPWGAYLSDHRWDVLAYNEQLVDDYPWILHGANVMEWILTYPEARAQLINWETEWAMPMLAQLRLHAEQWSNDARLKEVIETVLTDPVARRLWDSPNLPTLTHPPADTTRRLYLPRQGRTEFNVILLPMAPLDLPHCRFMAVMPV